MVDSMADTLPLVRAETLLDTVAYTVAKVKAETLEDILRDVERYLSTFLLTQ